MSDFDDWHNKTDSLCPRRAFEAGKQSQQAKIDELQARIDEVLEELEIDLQSPDYDDLRYRVGDAVDILKGNKDD